MNNLTWCCLLFLLCFFVLHNQGLVLADSPCSCEDPLAVCDTNNICICDIGHHKSFEKGKCLAVFGSRCQSSNECTTRGLSSSLCTQGICQCAPGYFYPHQPRRTDCFEVYGSTCKSSKECEDLLSFSVCHVGFCRCTDGYYYANSSQGCVMVHGSHCLGLVECTRRGGDNYTCGPSRTCDCTTDHYLLAGVCTQVKGSPCESHVQCISRSQEGFICDVDERKQCFAPCDPNPCGRGQCLIDTESTYLGFRCDCPLPFAGVSCHHNDTAVVITQLILLSDPDISGKALFDWGKECLLKGIYFSLCRKNSTCLNLKTNHLSIEMLSVIKQTDQVKLTYIVIRGNSAMPSTKVVVLMNALPPYQLELEMGCGISLPAIGKVQATPTDYCLLRWEFEYRGYSDPFSAQVQRILEYKLSNFFKSLLEAESRSSVQCTITDYTVGTDGLIITFAVLNDSTCLPALFLSRAVRNVSLAEITPKIMTPVSYPVESLFSLEPYIYYQEAFIIKTLMQESRNTSYFARNWRRYELALSRLLTTEAVRYDNLGRVIKKGQVLPGGSTITAKLLDIRRSGNSDVVELVAYAELQGVVIPIDSILQYLEGISAADLAIVLSEVLHNSEYVTRYDKTFRHEIELNSDSACLKGIKEINSTYWIRTVLRLSLPVSAEDEQEAITIFKNFVTKLVSPSGSSVVCLQMRHVGLLSYDPGCLEMVYLVMKDGSPLLSAALRKLLNYISMSDIENQFTQGESREKEFAKKLEYVTEKPAEDYSSAGQEFIVAFMENYVEVDKPEGSSYALRLYFTTCSHSMVEVLVEAPRHSSGFRASLTVRPEKETYIDIPQELAVMGTDVQPNAIRVTSNLSINVVAVNRDYLSHDSTLVLPVKQLSEDYMAVSHSSGDRSQLAIAAVVDCLVSIQLPLKDDGSPHRFSINGKEYAGEIEYSLRALEVLQIQLTGDVSGARIHSDKVIAVFAGNTAAGILGPSRDHLYEQMLPAAYSGIQYIVGQVQTEQELSPDLVKVVSTMPNTMLYIPSHSKDKLLLASAGSSYTLELVDRDLAVYIRSDRPVKVLQFLRSARGEFGDPSMLEVAPLNMKMSYHVITIPDAGYTGNFLHYLVLVIEKAQRDGLQLDGAALEISEYEWQTVPYTNPSMSMLSLKLSHGVHRLWHVKQASFMLNVYGMSRRESYSLRAGSCDSQDVIHFLSAGHLFQTTSSKMAASQSTVSHPNRLWFSAPGSTQYRLKTTGLEVWKDESPVTQSTFSLQPTKKPSSAVVSSKTDHKTSVSPTTSRHTSSTPTSITSSTTVSTTTSTTSTTTSSTTTSTTRSTIPSITTSTPATTTPSTTPSTTILTNADKRTSPTPGTTSIASTTSTTTERTRTTRSQKTNATINMSIARSAAGSITTSAAGSITNSTIVSEISKIITSLTSDVNEDTFTSAINPFTFPMANKSYWLQFALAERSRSLTGLEIKRIETVLVVLYTEESGKEQRVKRDDNSNTTKEVHAKIVKQERSSGRNLVVFYMAEGTSPVLSQVALTKLSLISALNLTRLMGVPVTSRIAEYGSEPDGNFLEAAEAADTTDPAESGSDTLILAVMLGIVGCVCAGALTALIATRSAKQKAKKKRGDKGATDEGAKEEAAGASNAALSNDDKSHFNSASASTPATPVAAAVLEVPSLLAAPREAVTPSLPSDIHAAGEEGHGDGTMNTTATDLQMDPNYKYGRNSGTIQPEYPLAMTAEELDELFAPYYIAHATRSELFANKKSLRSKKAPGLIKHRASEAHFTFEDIVNQLEDGQLPTDAKPSYTYQTKSKYVEKPRLNRKLSDPQHTERTKAELKTAHSDSIVNLAQGETILNRELTGQKLKKARLRQKKKENLQRQTRLQKADNPLQSVLIRRNKPTRPEESSSMSLPGSVLEQQSSETLLPLRTKHVQRRYEQGKTTLAKKSKKRTRRHMHELSDLQSTLMDDQLISPS